VRSAALRTSARAGNLLGMSVSAIELARDAMSDAAEALGCAVEFGRLSADEVLKAVGTVAAPPPEIMELWSIATPVNVSVPFAPEALSLFRPSVVVEKGAGYFGETWSCDWLVIGDIAGDPVIADTGRTGVPIMLAIHGMGTWRPATVAPTPAGFLAAVAAWLRVLHRFDGTHLDEGNDFNVKQGFERALRDELGLTLPAEFVSALVDYLET
jgi:hypothetical protein